MFQKLIEVIEENGWTIEPKEFAPGKQNHYKVSFVTPFDTEASIYIEGRDVKELVKDLYLMLAHFDINWYLPNLSAEEFQVREHYVNSAITYVDGLYGAIKSVLCQATGYQESNIISNNSVPFTGWAFNRADIYHHPSLQNHYLLYFKMEDGLYSRYCADVLAEDNDDFLDCVETLLEDFDSNYFIGDLLGINETTDPEKDPLKQIVGTKLVTQACDNLKRGIERGRKNRYSNS